MTEQEAIEIIKKNYPKRCQMVNGRKKGGFIDTDCELGQAFNMAIKAMEEVQQYRAIGTPEECRAAVEKQTAKKPKKTESAGYRYTDTYRCQNCGGNFSGTGIANYCYRCGQKLDWSEEE